MAAATLNMQDQEILRSERLNEPGTEPPCPLCGRPRVKRSDYIRCNPCATNWVEGENIMGNPRVERWKRFMQDIRRTKPGNSNTAPPAEPTSNQ